MDKNKWKNNQKKRRAHRTRRALGGTADRPRLCVHRSLKHISVQLIDDSFGKVLAFADDRELNGKKQAQALEVGKRIAVAALARNIKAVVFDRGAYRYHGRVRAVAEGARQNGLVF